MTNIYDKANELERALRKNENYLAVVDAFEVLEKNAESKELYKEFVATQTKFMNAMQLGEQPSEEDMKQFQELQTKLMADNNVNNLLQAQQKLQFTIEDLNRVIYKPLEELFTKYEK